MKAIAGGNSFNVIARADGSVVVWGNNYGNVKAVPPAATNIAQVAAGDAHVTALRHDGTVIGWGDGLSSHPSGESNVIAVAAGNRNTFLLKADGTVVGWGGLGPLNLGQAVPPAGLSNVVAIAAGSLHSLALKRDGAVVGWGYNIYGQSTPPADLTNATAIAAAYENSMAIRSNGLDLPNATNSHLTIASVTADHTGAYSVVARNPNGSVENVPAALSVVPVELIVDNPQAQLVGSWDISIGGTGQSGSDYRTHSQGSGADSANFMPLIPLAEVYEVYEWHPQAATRSIAVPHRVRYSGGSQMIFVNQTTNGSRWNLLGTFPFVAGTAGQVSITDAFPDAGQSAAADAIRFVYLPPPVIVLAPQDESVMAGDAAEFQVITFSTSPMLFQWQRNNQSLPGATQDRLQLANVQAGAAGIYRVLVNNSGGTVSREAMLTVGIPLRFDSAAGAVTLTWTGPLVLQTATALTGPWVDVPGAASPWWVAIGGEKQRYFRLRPAP